MTREEAHKLIQVLKKITEKGIFFVPEQGKRKQLHLLSVFSDKDHFDVIINRAGVNSKKYTLVLRYGKDQGLLRIDMGGGPHTNPDGTIIACPHLHMQQKDTGKWDAWAEDIPAVFGDTEDCVQTLKDFLQYCNVNNISCIEICEQKGME